MPTYITNWSVARLRQFIKDNGVAAGDSVGWSGPSAGVISATGSLGIGTTTPIAKIDAAGKIAITTESATPDQPDDGHGYLYSKSDGKVYWRSYDVTEVDLTQNVPESASNVIAYQSFS